MCYNVNAKARIEVLQKRFSAYYDEYEEFPSYEDAMINGFAHPKLPVITTDAPDKIRLMKWGLIPNWEKDEQEAHDMQNKTLNARSETIFKKGVFTSVLKKRCMVLVEGFYEWQHVGKKKIPYFVHLIENGPFALGGLYDEWTNPNTGEITEGFSIVTLPANPLMAEIHNSKKRMPLILQRDTERMWVNPLLAKEEIADLIKQYPSHSMVAEKLNTGRESATLF